MKYDRLKETAGAVVDGRVEFRLDSDQLGSKLIVISEVSLAYEFLILARNT